MKFTPITLVLALLAHTTSANPLPVPKVTKPPYFITIGDSTVAVNGG
jgi:hypothetical protein